jgi:hypothetical protein
MLNLYLHQHAQAVFDLNFLNQKEAKTYVIAPSPDQADSLRQNFLRSSHPHHALEVITISHFIKTMLDSSCLTLDYHAKSSMLIKLATVWKKFFSEYPYEYFSRSYNLLTDLRSFTLDQDILNTVLEQYDPLYQKAIAVFNQVIMLQGWSDEHLCYNLLAEYLRQPESEHQYAGSNIIFAGFRFLSGTQVDFIKALSIRSDVYVPVDKRVYLKSRSTDWIKWLEDVKTKIIDNEEREARPSSCQLAFFPKNRMAQYFKLFYEQEENWHQNNFTIVLGNRQIKDDEALEVPLSHIYFKTPVNIFEESLAYLLGWIGDQIKNGPIDIDDFLVDLDLLVQNFKKQQNFLSLKLCSELKKIVVQWQELSAENKMLDAFEYKLITDIVKLNLPRNSMLNLIAGESDINIIPISKIAEISPQKKRVIVASSHYQSILAGVQTYSEQVEKYLTSIGPIRRIELEFEYLKSHFLEDLNHENTFILMENGLLEHNLYWKSLLDSVDQKIIHFETNSYERNYYDFVKSNETSFTKVSATRLQTYFDCPRKYYLNYVAKIIPQIELKHTLQANHIGSIEHKIIEIYLNQNMSFIEANFNAVAESTYNTELKRLNMELTTIDYKKYLEETKRASRNGVLFMLGLANEFNIKDPFKLEYQFKLDLTADIKQNGSIDCLYVDNSKLVLIDFKRSSSSIPKASQLAKLEKLQLWFYLSALKKLNLYRDDFIIGFVNLSDLGQSLLFTNNSEVSALAIDEQVIKIKKFDDKQIVAFENYPEHEASIIEKLKADQTYAVSPRNSTVCQFCSVEAVCPKQEAKHV